MIGRGKDLRRVCRNYEMVENYEAAIADETQVWDLHHRREIDENKSRQQLKDEGKYYDVTAEELIFLTHSEHRKIHSKATSRENNLMFGKHHSAAAKQKISKATAGENNPMFGKRHSEASKKKMSEAKKGDKHPQFGWHWWNDGKVSIKSKEQPGQDFVRGRLK